MKRRKSKCFVNILLSVWTLLVMLDIIYGAIVPPPWSDPIKNPCALMSGGWQMIYWPPLKKCFKIFNTGYPCPDTMELAPKAVLSEIKKPKSSMTFTHNAPIAECRCPPGTAMSVLTNKCHKLFERGPCNHGEYFKPLPPKQEHITRNNSNRTSISWGICELPAKCEKEGQLYWPNDNKCYAEYSRGPCFKGKLLILNENNLAECKCHNSGNLKKFFYNNEETCHELYTKGPCSTPGHIFLPGGHCGCTSHLPNYHEEHNMCYELGTPGPCPSGHIFSLPTNELNTLRPNRAQCICKADYVPWSDGLCYRLYTRGPCAANEFLINSTSCAKHCVKNRLYFPEQKSCYRIGAQGPCPLHQVVVFDFNAKPSIDGIPYNGVCGCSGILKDLGLQCEPTSKELKALDMMYATAMPSTIKPTTSKLNCDAKPGMVLFKGSCHQLYSQGPCANGQWLEVVRPRTALEYKTSEQAKCVCRPGYTPAQQLINDSNDNTVDSTALGILQPCNAPVVSLARYLNHFQYMQQTGAHNYNKFPTNGLNLGAPFTLN